MPDSCKLINLLWALRLCLYSCTPGSFEITKRHARSLRQWKAGKHFQRTVTVRHSALDVQRRSCTGGRHLREEINRRGPDVESFCICIVSHSLGTLHTRQILAHEHKYGVPSEYTERGDLGERNWQQPDWCDSRCASRPKGSRSNVLCFGTWALIEDMFSSQSLRFTRTGADLARQ